MKLSRLRAKVGEHNACNSYMLTHPLQSLAHGACIQR